MILMCIPLPTGRSHLGHNISCYNCEGIERHCTKATLKANHHKYLKNCHGIGDRCMRIWQKTDYTELVHSLCADERLCDEMEKVCEEKRLHRGTLTIASSLVAMMTLATRLTLA